MESVKDVLRAIARFQRLDEGDLLMARARFSEGGVHFNASLPAIQGFAHCLGVHPQYIIETCAEGTLKDFVRLLSRIMCL